MTQEEKYLQWMEEFFCEEDGETCKEYVIETSNNGKLSLLWNAILYGRLGRYVRNFMRFAHPEIDEDFPMSSPAHKWANVVGNIHDNPEMLKK